MICPCGGQCAEHGVLAGKAIKCKACGRYEVVEKCEHPIKMMLKEGLLDDETVYLAVCETCPAEFLMFTDETVVELADLGGAKQ
jgi:hypothetical protein